jgi:hypothetical protein
VAPVKEIAVVSLFGLLEMIESVTCSRPVP